MIATLPRRPAPRAGRHRAQQDARRAHRARHPHRHHRRRHRRARSPRAPRRDRRRDRQLRRERASTCGRSPVQASGARSKFAGRLTEDDVRAIAARGGEHLGRRALSCRRSGQVVYGDKNWQTQLIGTTLPYYPIRRWTIARGANWTETDETPQDEGVRRRADGRDEPLRHRGPRRAARSASGARPTRVVGVLGARGVEHLRRRPGRPRHDADRQLPRARHAHAARARRPAHLQRDERRRPSTAPRSRSRASCASGTTSRRAATTSR